MVIVLMVTSFVFADKYKVLYVNSTGIKIETKNVAVGSVFTDKDKIVWTDDQQAMKVINLNTNRVMVLAANQGLDWADVEKVLEERNEKIGNLKTFHQVDKNT